MYPIKYGKEFINVIIQINFVEYKIVPKTKTRGKNPKAKAIGIKV